ncbi:MAG: hypothetical protein ABSB31_11065 [Dehalococcoidia bacterium]
MKQVTENDATMESAEKETSGLGNGQKRKAAEQVGRNGSEDYITG